MTGSLLLQPASSSSPMVKHPLGSRLDQCARSGSPASSATCCCRTRFPCGSAHHVHEPPTAERSAGEGSDGSVPVADLHVAGVGGALPGLEELLEAHEVRAPLGAAVVHELDRLTPALVLEEHDRVLVLLVEIPLHAGADPFLRSVHDVPADEPARIELSDLHVEAARP